MISRRRLLTAGFTGMTVTLAEPAFSQRVTAQQPLKPGEFQWTPERSPEGPVVLIVSLPEQLVHVYRNGIEIGVSTCSTGKPGHRTPTGVFTILEKDRKHVSNIYKRASMPNMERLTWGGIALHAGNLPGYPASHGCIRLPLKFSALLYEVTHLGVVVIIADERTQPADVVHPGILMSSVADAEARAVAAEVRNRKARSGWEPTVTYYPVSSMLISRADGKAYITEDGKLTATYPCKLANAKRPIGTHVYSLIGPAADGSGLKWLAFGIGKSRHDAHIVSWSGDEALKRVSFYDTAHAERAARALHPGATLMLTDASAPRPTRTTPKDFSIISSSHDA